MILIMIYVRALIVSSSSLTFWETTYSGKNMKRLDVWPWNDGGEFKLRVVDVGEIKWETWIQWNEMYEIIANT